MSEWQDVIREAVERRGYTQGEMTREQYAFSQLCKMVSEVNEYAHEFIVAPDESSSPYALTSLFRLLDMASQSASVLFNNPKAMGGVWAREQACNEIADVLVTVAMSASALGIDIERIAIEKATQDVTRGVR